LIFFYLPQRWGQAGIFIAELSMTYNRKCLPVFMYTGTVAALCRLSGAAFKNAANPVKGCFF